MIVYRIRNWPSHFENANSRKVEHCRWVCMPNKQDGLGLSRILAEPDGATIFGIWCLMLQACSRQVRRNGWLTDNGDADGQPWDLDDLSMRWRRPITEIEKTLKTVSSPKVGWMQQLQSKWVPTGSQPPVHPSALGPTGPEGMEGMEGMEGTTGVVSQRATSPSHSMTEDDHDDETASTPIGQTAHGLSTWVRWQAKDQSRQADNLAELDSLVTTYGVKLVQAAAERLVHREHRKAWVNELLAEILGDKPGSGENPRYARCRLLVEAHGWKSCAAAAGLPESTVANDLAMTTALIADLDTYDRVVAKLAPDLACPVR